MSDVLNNIRQKIDDAVKQRKRYKDLVNGKVDLLNKLKAQIKECYHKVSASSFENKDIYAEKLFSAERMIDDILKDSAPLINRFNRDTINLGVAGATQAGKSTFLEVVSGVKLPRAKGERSGDSTTAAKSIIINSSEKKAVVYFRNKQEFVELVKAYLPENYKSRVSDIDDFRQMNLQAIYDECTESTARYEISKLQDAQESLPYLIDYIREDNKKEISLDKLADYVTYFQCQDAQHRFWPVVKVVKIYCPFTALGHDQIKLTLVDLPGMGECKRVDDDMVEGLNNEVDTVLLLFLTSAIQPDRDFKTFDAIKNAQKYVKDKTKFLSFFINIDESKKENLEGQINSKKITIKKNFTHNGEEYKQYETAVIKEDKSFNYEKVHQDVFSVLSKLVGDIDSLDSDTYNGWMETLDDFVANLKKQVNEIANKIKDDLPYTEDDQDEIEHRKEDMVNALANYNLLEVDYEVANKINGIRKVINTEVQKIYDLIERAPLNNPNWDADFTAQRTKSKGVDILTTELSRLWTYIRREYRQIENIADGLLNNLKNDILDRFNQLVGKNDFITKRGDDGVHELLDKIADKEISMPFFTSAFESLLSEKICFNQIVYPYIVESKLAKSISNDSRVGGLISDDSFKVSEGTSKEEERKFFKDKLIQVVLGVNGEMLSLICDKTPFAIAAFLYAKMEYFNDCLNRTTFDAKIKGDCFRHFCKAFRLELWPERFGSSSKIVAARELSKSISEIGKLIEELNK